MIADAKPEDADLLRRFGADLVVWRGDDFSAVCARWPRRVAAV